MLTKNRIQLMITRHQFRHCSARRDRKPLIYLRNSPPVVLSIAFRMAVSSYIDGIGDRALHLLDQLLAVRTVEIEAKSPRTKCKGLSQIEATATTFECCPFFGDVDVAPVENHASPPCRVRDHGAA